MHKTAQRKKKMCIFTTIVIKEMTKSCNNLKNYPSISNKKTTHIIFNYMYFQSSSNL